MENEAAVRYLDDADATVDQKNVDSQFIGRKRTHSKTEEDSPKDTVEETGVKASGDDHQTARKKNVIEESSKSPIKQNVEAESEVGDSLKTAVENVEDEFSNCSVKSAKPSQEVKPTEQSSLETQEEVDVKPDENADPDQASDEKPFAEEDIPKAPSSKKQKSN